VAAIHLAASRLTRRDFVKSAALACGALAAPNFIPASALGRDGAVAPSERIILGAIGIGPRGRHDLTAMLDEPDVQFVAICDVQKSRCEIVKKMADNKYGNTDCVMIRDMRELLARPDIDAVLIATGDHWHALASIMAVKAGKDVYSEKPCGITIGQCQALDNTVRRYGRVFQAGTQRRSISNFQFAVHLARTGKLGKIRTLHASVYRPECIYSWLPSEPEPPKDEVDWDLWLGPSPWRPYNSLYVAGRWRKHYDFDSGGTLLDWGAHTVDLCQWAIGADDTTPVEFVPSHDNIVARYANGVELVLDYLDTPFGDRSPHYRTELGTCPVRFEGDEGWVETGDAGDIALHPESLRAELKGFRRSSGLSVSGHGRDFFDCVKSRGLTVANSNVMRHSHLACHAAAMAWQLNRPLRFDPVHEEFIGDQDANRMITRAMREPWHV
jgi:predicted dehydrogenase